MDLKGVHNYFSSLEQKLGELGVSTTYVEGTGGSQIGDTLRILFPVTEEGHAAIMEIMVLNLAEGIDLVMVYSTLVVELNEKADELPQKLLEWNILCPLGAYGIYEEERQLYHKYSLPINAEEEPENLAENTMTLLELLFDVFSAQYPTYSAYASEE